MIRKIKIFFCVLVFFISCKKDKSEIADKVNSQTPYVFVLPESLPNVIPNIQNNPTTNEGVLLGRHLFYEKKLSSDFSKSCSSCHVQENAFSDPNKFSVGVNGQLGHRNSMSIQNLMWNRSLFWDLRASTLEQQAGVPITDPIEMNSTWEDVTFNLSSDEDYKSMFYNAFGSELIDSVSVTNALAQFMRTLISGDSKFDRYLRGDPGVQLSDLEEEGMNIFSTEGNVNGTGGDCFHCHNSVDGLFQSQEAHNNALDQTFTDLGLGEISGYYGDNGKFKVPSLRNLEYTAPYMHDGRFSTLEEVIDHYNTGGHFSPTVSPFMKNIDEGLHLSDRQKQALIAFLKTLSDQDFVSNPNFSNPKG